ncbi:MAG: hypothetical protein AABX66_04130 [Nanoarchaeota archaeon]
MENKTLIVIILIIVILAGGIIFFKESLKKSPVTNLQECKTLKFNNEKAFNILFFSEKGIAEKNMQYFLNSEPYVNSQNAFNFYYIDDYTPVCELYKGIALYCHSSDLVKKAASCPNDYIVVLQKQGNSIRSSAYQNVISINSEHPLSTLLHEFAHVFAGLDDEYVPATIGFMSKNCLSSCDKFDVSDGCFEGCGEDKYFRSIDAGLMRTLSTRDYGKFDKGIINSILEKRSASNSKITGNVIINEYCNNQKYYLVIGKIVNGSIEIIDKSLEIGCASGAPNVGQYNYSVLDENGGKIIQTPINAEMIYTDIQPEGAEIIEGGANVSDKEFILTVPFVDQPLKLRIENNSGQILSETNLEGLNNLACKI